MTVIHTVCEMKDENVDLKKKCLYSVVPIVRIPVKTIEFENVILT